MGCRQNAEEDGIEFKHEPGHKTIYFVPCSKCGAKIRKTRYLKNHEYTCKYCERAKAKKDFAISNMLTPAEIRFEKALKEMSEQIDDFGSYKRQIEIARSRVELYGSIPECMVAIELIHNKHSIIPQQRIGKYKVDFLLPREKMVVEVDGKMFHNKPTEGERELFIWRSLGIDWKIVHIPAELIRKDIKQLEVLLALKD